MIFSKPGFTNLYRFLKIKLNPIHADVYGLATEQTKQIIQCLETIYDHSEHRWVSEEAWNSRIDDGQSRLPNNMPNTATEARALVRNWVQSKSRAI